MLQKYWQGVVDLIFPPICYACGQYEPLKDLLLCHPCNETLPWIDHSGVAKAALEGKEHFPVDIEDINSLLFFTKNSKTQKLIQEIKYHGQRRLAVFLGELVGQKLKLEKDHSNSILVPVPIHHKRLRERGYNQAYEIAKGIQSSTEIPIENDILIRATFEGSQTAKNKYQRAKILDAAFTYNSLTKVNRNTNIILIDDVITTGATIRSCSNQLRKAGFKNIEVACLAISI